MKKGFYLSAIILFAITFNADAQNTIIFNNKSRQPVLVKLIGPTYKEINIPENGKADVRVSAGLYSFQARYGIPGNYLFRRSKSFKIIESKKIQSQTTITLQLENSADLSTQPISEKGFESVKPPFSLGCNDESETAIAWARFVLNESFIRPETRMKIQYAVSVSAKYTDMMAQGEVTYLDPKKIGFHPVALSQVVKVLGKWEEENNEGGMRLLRWGGLVLKCDIEAQHVVSFGFTKAFFLALSRQSDIVTEAGECLRDAMQLAAKRSSPWRKAERKFCELVGLPYLPDTLDNGEQKGMIGFSTIAKNVNLTEAKIKAVCGDPTRRIPGNKIYSGVYYGRVGYKRKGGIMSPELWAFYSMSSLEKMVK